MVLEVIVLDRMLSSERPIGSRFQIFCSALEGSNVMFSWEKDGSSMQESRARIRNEDATSILSIQKVARTDAGKYTCTAMNAVSSSSVSAKLIVRVMYEWHRGFIPSFEVLKEIADTTE
ncbi:titin-like [Tropilaelaps mercedesae]|uniref:Titin-like n=1 Tax=Tropilaelaps mercedesae TaxID=418985 RepID=A0A1V9XVL3_9ACAR|nr:titin-like [Tropilaelaps mercedesae]